MSTKGQITLPSEFREELNLDKGSKMVVLIKEGWIFMKPVKRLTQLRGILRDVEKSSKELVRELRREWDKELEELI
ncbi:MAG: AbrB/MazE/SpoVT family DNA-binding domain-containing protein [Candidatus Aenigmarchaeota archaeon]|nr:AbrB/MazE/SpoVT family DNA-binding domain-containing protein [Candidatus Aenigmarchaeota archaeon]